MRQILNQNIISRKSDKKRNHSFSLLGQVKENSLTEHIRSFLGNGNEVSL